MANIIAILIISGIVLYSTVTITIQPLPMYFATSADTQFFPCVLNLIGTLHKHHFKETSCIAVFDLGFTQEERTLLESIEKVKLCALEQTCPAMFSIFRTPAGGPYIRGWYTWKPVAIKQALDMFPYVLYIDAGISVVGSLTKLFEHIYYQGYFLIDCGHSIRWMTTKNVRNYFSLTSDNVLLDQFGISAGFQGLSRKLYDSYVMPMYEHTFDITLFEDDGSAPNGYGYARHDQALFSIYARRLGLKVTTALRSGEGTFIGKNGKHVPFALSSLIAFTRHNINLAKIKPYIHYKKNS